MHNYCKTIGALAAVSALAAGTASAEIEGEVHVGYSTEYLFRGLDLGDDLVEAGVDVAYETNGFGLSAGAWYGSFESRDSFDDSIDIDELDLYGEVSKDLGFATLGVGYIYYYNMGNDNTTLFGPSTENFAEAYVSLSRDFGFAQIGLTYFHGVKGDNDGYSELTLGKSWEINSCLAVNLNTATGYLVEQGQLGHITAKLSLDYNFAGTAKLSPFIAHSWALSDDNDTVYFGSKNQLVGGAMISVGF